MTTCHNIIKCFAMYDVPICKCPLFWNNWKHTLLSSWFHYDGWKWYIIKWNSPNRIYSQRHCLIKLAMLWPYITMWLSCLIVCCAWFVIIGFFVVKSRIIMKNILQSKVSFSIEISSCKWGVILVTGSLSFWFIHCRLFLTC